MGAIWLPAGLRPATREVVNITAGDGLGQGGQIIGKQVLTANIQQQISNYSNKKTVTSHFISTAMWPPQGGPADIYIHICVHIYIYIYIRPRASLDVTSTP